VPYRKVPLRTGFIYHVYDQGIDRRVVFSNRRFYRRFFITLRFYQYNQRSVKLANYLEKGSDKLSVLIRIREHPKLVTVMAYCLMPNHFHLIIRQEMNNGISKYVGDVLNSYTKYFNIRNKRKGSLFLNPFRTVRVETDEQLLHLVRYIHLNPYSSGITGNIEETLSYPYSSLAEYLELRPNDGLIDSKMINSYFTSAREHGNFVTEQAEYQKTLDSIKHLTFDDEPE